MYSVEDFQGTVAYCKTVGQNFGRLPVLICNVLARWIVLR